MDILHWLPSEILLEILSSLPATDLASTSRLSHRLHDISQPLLFTAPCLTTSRDNAELTALPSSLESFLTILLSPRGRPLAVYVRSLTLHWTNAKRHCIGPRPHPLLDDLALLTPAPSPFALSSQMANTQVMLLLARLPHLQVLYVIDENRGTETFDDFIVEASTWLMPHSHAFRSLREVCVSSTHRDYGVSQPTLHTLMMLPVIEDIDVSLSTLHYFDPSLFTTYSSTLTKLWLWGGILWPDELLWILRVPRCLTHFSCSLADRFDFRPALVPLRSSLQCLYLKALYSGGLRPDEELSDLAVGSLREWTCLRTLRCSMVLLLGYGLQQERLRLVDVLPVGLCELEFLWDNEYPAEAVVVEVVELLAHRAELVPALKSVKVKWAVGTELEMLREACRTVNVEFIKDGAGEGGAGEDGASEDGSDYWGFETM